MKSVMVSSMCNEAAENSPKSAPVGAKAKTSAFRAKRSRSTVNIPRTIVTRSMSRKMREQLLDQVQTSESMEIKKEKEQQEEEEAFQEPPVQKVEKELIEQPLVQLETKEELLVQLEIKEEPQVLEKQPQLLMEVEEPKKQPEPEKEHSQLEEELQKQPLSEQEKLVPHPMPQPEPEKEHSQLEEDLQKQPLLEQKQLVPHPMPQPEQEARNEVAVEGNGHGLNLRGLIDFSMVQFLPFTHADEHFLYKDLSSCSDLVIQDVYKAYSRCDHRPQGFDRNANPSPNPNPDPKKDSNDIKKH